MKVFPTHRHNELKKNWNKQVCKSCQKLGEIQLKRNYNGQKPRKHNIREKSMSLVHMKGNKESYFVIPFRQVLACCKEETNMFSISLKHGTEIFSCSSCYFCYYCY